MIRRSERAGGGGALPSAATSGAGASMPAGWGWGMGADVGEALKAG